MAATSNKKQKGLFSWLNPAMRDEGAAQTPPTDISSTAIAAQTPSTDISSTAIAAQTPSEDISSTAVAAQTPPTDISSKAKEVNAMMQGLLAGVNSIVQFTATYPVNNLRWNDLPLWPTIRFYLTIAVNLHASGKYRNGRFYAPLVPYDWMEQHLHDKTAIRMEGYHDDGPVDFIIFSANKSISWCDLNKRCYDRLIDPVVEKLEKYGRVKKFILINSSGMLRDDFHIKPECIMLSPQYTVNNYLDVENFDLFCAKLTGAFPMFKLTKPDIIFYLDMVFHIYNSYLKLFKKIKPKAIFFFPIDYNIPMVMAAKNLGITTVDIQHGNLIGYYLQYNQWNEIQKNYKRVLPDAVMVWGQREKEHVERELRHVKGVIGGYPWLDDPIHARVAVPLSLTDFCARFDYIVGISLSAHPTPPELVLEIARDPRATAKNIGFIFKRNPKRDNTDIPEADNIYAAEELTNAPFFSLAKHFNLHITEASTCVYEADYAGVQTFIVGENWDMHFEELVKSRRFTLVQDVDTFYARFDQAVDRCLYPRLVENNNPEFDQFIRSLLADPPDA